MASRCMNWTAGFLFYGPRTVDVQIALHRRGQLDGGGEQVPIAAGTKLGRYEIRSKIGAGGMGEVYLAEDGELHRKVALKILPADVVPNKDRMRDSNRKQQRRQLSTIRTSHIFTRLA